MNENKPKTYLVTLKTGDTAYFPNNNDYEDYPSRLVSGIYGITPANGGDAVPITPDSVESIVEVETQD